MLVYLSAPYSNVENKDKLMETVLTYAGKYMTEHDGHHIVTPLLNHFMLPYTQELGSTYEFWKAYSRDLLYCCNSMILLCLPGWTTSVGVQDELAMARSRNIKVTFVEV